MKVRKGFVSNSSSSSFIILVDETKTDILVTLIDCYKFSTREKTLFGMEPFFGTNKALQEKLKERIKLNKGRLNSLVIMKKFITENLKNKDFLEFYYTLKNIPEYAQDKYATDRLLNEDSIIIKLAEETIKRSEEILKLIKPLLLDELIVIFSDDKNYGRIDRLGEEKLEILKKEED
jgi:hypothetical protein